jgi:hypothetical protein
MPYDFTMNTAKGISFDDYQTNGRLNRRHWREFLRSILVDARGEETLRSEATTGAAKRVRGLGERGWGFFAE